MTDLNSKVLEKRSKKVHAVIEQSIEDNKDAYDEEILFENEKITKKKRGFRGKKVKKEEIEKELKIIKKVEVASQIITEAKKKLNQQEKKSFI